MAYRVFITLVLLSLLSGCGKIVFPDSWKGRQIPSSVTKHDVKKGRRFIRLPIAMGLSIEPLPVGTKSVSPIESISGSS